MKVLRAQEMGMCFGVRDALKIAQQVADPTRVTIHGELVHNSQVNRRLAEAGFRQSAEDDRHRASQAPVVLITAHGISDAERRRLNAADKQLIDTTCPLVCRAHKAALELQAEGRHVLLIGKPGHVEVKGIVEDLESYDIIERESEVRNYERCDLGIVCQTTMPPDVVTEICSHIQRKNPRADIRLVDTVCDPTKRRQAAMLELLGRVDAVVVVGGRNSNNTIQLVELCHKHHIAVTHVECAEQLEPEWFDEFDIVGLTAGTSTLDETIDGVQHALEQFALRRRQERSP
jgi:4-hydroxy-3-methylbut-2-enyl diphosphate reductase